MTSYLKIKKLKIMGAPLYVHWSVAAASLIILIASWRELIYALIALVSYLGIILIHESGHAFFAVRAGCKVLRIKLGLVHGLCEYQPPHSDWENMKIVWGGVVSQLLVVLCVLLLVLVLGDREPYYFRPVVIYLGAINLIIALTNLAPLPSLDGYKAWRIVPMLYRRWLRPKPKWQIKNTRRHGEKKQ